MSYKKLNNPKETTAAFALSVFLTNFLIIAVLAVTGWAISTIIGGNSEFYTFLRGGFIS